MKKKNKTTWQQLKEKGWKVYNDGISNRMFPNATSAKKAGYSMEGYAPRYSEYTTHFTYSELNRYK